MKNKILLYLLLGTFNGLYAERLSLSQAYALALENSKNIKMNAYQVEIQKKRVEQAKSELYPQVYLSGSYGRKEYGANGLAKFSNYAVTLQQSVYNPTIKRRVDVEESKATLSETEIELQKQELSTLVLQLYLEILKAENKIGLYTSYIDANQDKLNLLEKKYSMALSNKMDVLEGEVAYHFSRIDLRKEKKNLRLNRLRLKHLIGTGEIDLPNIQFGRINDTTIGQMRATIQAEENRLFNLRIQMAQQSVDISKKEIKAAASEHLPNLSLSGQYAKIDADRTISSFENTKSLMLELRIPLYQGGMVKSRVQSAKLMHQAREEELLLTQDEIQEQYVERLALFDDSVGSLEFYQEALSSAELYLDSIEQGLQNGLKSKIELNDAKNKLYEVKYEYLENMYDILDSYIGLLILTNRLDQLGLVDEVIGMN